jgi:hypothetical protein
MSERTGFGKHTAVQVVEKSPLAGEYRGSFQVEARGPDVALQGL